MFEDLPLENFGNRIPNITAEVTFNAQEAYPALKSTNLPGGPLDSVLTDYGSTDHVRQRQLMLSPDGLRLFDLRTLEELAQGRPEDLISDALAETLNLYRDNYRFDHCFIGGDGYRSRGEGVAADHSASVPLDGATGGRSPRRSRAAVMRRKRSLQTQHFTAI